MHKRFVFAREEESGEAWLARFKAGRSEAERWYREGRGAPDVAECRAALRDHMPELLPLTIMLAGWSATTMSRTVSSATIARRR